MLGVSFRERAYSGSILGMVLYYSWYGFSANDFKRGFLMREIQCVIST